MSPSLPSKPTCGRAPPPRRHAAMSGTEPEGPTAPTRLAWARALGRGPSSSPLCSPRESPRTGCARRTLAGCHWGLTGVETRASGNLEFHRSVSWCIHSLRSHSSTAAKERHRLTSNWKLAESRASKPRAIDMSGWTVLCGGELSGENELFSSIFCLCLLDARSTHLSVEIIKNISRHRQMAPGSQIAPL